MKFIVSCIALLLINIHGKCQASLPKDCIAYYRFKGNAKDDSGNAHDGVVHGAVLVADRFNRPNSAYNFKGNAYIEISGEGIMHDEYSYSLWVAADVLPGKGQSQSIFSFGDETGRCQGLGINNAYGSHAGYGFGAGSYSMGSHYVAGVNTGVMPVARAWHHVVTIRTSQWLRVFVDGQLKGENRIPNLAPFYGDPATIRLASRKNRGQNFSGTIDDLRLYKRVLSAAEVAALYAAESLPK